MTAPTQASLISGTLPPLGYAQATIGTADSIETPDACDIIPEYEEIIPLASPPYVVRPPLEYCDECEQVAEAGKPSSDRLWSRYAAIKEAVRKARNTRKPLGRCPMTNCNGQLTADEDYTPPTPLKVTRQQLRANARNRTDARNWVWNRCETCGTRSRVFRLEK